MGGERLAGKADPSEWRGKGGEEDLNCDMKINLRGLG